MFGRLYVGELKKLARPKALVILCSVLIVMLFGYAVIYNFIGDLSGMLVTMTGDGEMPEETALNETTVDSYIAQYEAMIEETEKEYKTAKMGYSAYPSLFSLKATLTAYKFIRDKGLYNGDMPFLGIDYNIGVSADGFASDYMSVVTSIMAIYAIVVGAGLLADEYRNGTVKLLLTRPITKNQLITAKLLAALTVSLGVAALFSFIGYIYGLIAFSAETTKSVYLVFNASSVVRSTVGAYLFGTFVLDLFRIATMCLIGYFIGTLAKKKSTGIIIAIIINAGIVSGLLGLLPVQIAMLLPNMSLMNYFTANASVPIYGNFFISLAVYVVYLAAITFGLYYSVNKRDVI